MNERINELFGKALDQAVPETWTTLTPAQLSKLKEKFAELIVKECISVGMAKSKELFSYSKKEGDIFEYESHGAEDAVDSIKEHFGVE